MEIAFDKDSERNFTFAFISDSHITQIKDKEFMRNCDRGLIRAVAETNLMDPRPDLVFYGSDIAQFGRARGNRSRPGNPLRPEGQDPLRHGRA